MLACVFPGQGSQSPGMAKYLFENFPLAKELFEEASDSIGLDFKKLLFDSSAEDLALTANTQPALLLSSVVFFKCLYQEKEFEISAMAGHSVGEYAAIVCAGALSFSDGVKAVRTRGEAMQSAVPVGKGSMAAVVGLTPEEVGQLCQWARQESDQWPLDPANYNSPDQTVISGNANAIKWMIEHFKKEVHFPEAKKVRILPLKVSAPFHCSMMEPAEEVMKETLEQMTFNNTTIPVIQNVTAEAETIGLALKDFLIKQVTSPVRWVDGLRTMQHMNIKQTVECGNGKVLTGLMRKTAPDITCLNANSLEEFKELINKL